MILAILVTVLMSCSKWSWRRAQAIRSRYLRTTLRHSAAQACKSRSGALASMRRTGWSVAGWDIFAQWLSVLSVGINKTSSSLGEKLLPFAASRRVVAICGFADRGYEEPGRPEGFPHTATIERISGASATATVFRGARLIHVSSGLRNTGAELAQRHTHSRQQFQPPQPICKTCNAYPWRGSELPLGDAVVVIRGVRYVWEKRPILFRGRFAAQQEQASSQLGVFSYEVFRHRNCMSHLGDNHSSGASHVRRAASSNAVTPHATEEPPCRTIK